MKTSIYVYSKAIFSFTCLIAFSVQSDVVYYTLDNVRLADNTQMTGMFSWTYNPKDFENGTGQFLSLDIPYTTHSHTNLNTTFDIKKSIEITLEGSVHDDGVDISLVLTQALTSTSSSLLNLVESKYEIGGNGFHTGSFNTGGVSRVNIFMNIVPLSPDSAEISWEPELPGFVLQETTSLTPTNWANSVSGSTNYVVIPLTAPIKFFRVAQP
jgi:hypothetical protein